MTVDFHFRAPECRDHSNSDVATAEHLPPSPSVGDSRDGADHGASTESARLTAIAFARGILLTFTLIAMLVAFPLKAAAQFGAVTLSVTLQILPNWVKQAADMATQIAQAKQQITLLQTQIQQQITQMNPLQSGQSQGWTQQLGSLDGSLTQVPGESQQQVVAGETARLLQPTPPTCNRSSRQ